MTEVQDGYSEGTLFNKIRFKSLSQIITFCYRFVLKQNIKSDLEFYLPNAGYTANSM